MTFPKSVLIGILAGVPIALAAFFLLGRDDTADVQTAAPTMSPHEITPPFSPPETTLPDTDSDELDRSDSIFSAESIALQGLIVAFTWYPATDTNANDALVRARPWLTRSLAGRMLVDARTERGPSVQWGEWATEGAKIVADVNLDCSGCPPDSSTAIRRVATIRQTAVTAARSESVDPELTVWVTLTKNADQWLIDEIRY
ncbi:hypothetical protein [Rhodococcus sp. PSBB049]|uniref:hypothetical protein n=1 Tax=Rhodococcus sp. PSBB049 TaxID=2812863 RepID=UPI001F11A593|nr:hypothetical protein [Rhodococcus sp. PSBB049]